MPDYVQIFETGYLADEITAEMAYQDQRVALKVLEIRASDLRKKLRTEGLSEEDWLRIRLALIAVLIPESQLEAVGQQLSREIIQVNENLARVVALGEVYQAMVFPLLEDSSIREDLGRRYDRLFADLGREWTDTQPKALPSENEDQQSSREDENFPHETSFTLLQESVPAPGNFPLTSVIRQFRTALGDTQQQFATRTGVSVATIARYESNSRPSRKILEKFAALARECNAPEYVQAFQAGLRVRVMSKASREQDNEAREHQKIAMEILDERISLLWSQWIEKKVSAQESLRIRIALMPAVLAKIPLAALDALLSRDVRHIDEQGTQLASTHDPNCGTVSSNATNASDGDDPQRRVQTLKAELSHWAQEWPPRS